MQGAASWRVVEQARAREFGRLKYPVHLGLACGAVLDVTHFHVSLRLAETAVGLEKPPVSAIQDYNVWIVEVRVAVGIVGAVQLSQVAGHCGRPEHRVLAVEYEKACAAQNRAAKEHVLQFALQRCVHGTINVSALVFVTEPTVHHNVLVEQARARARKYARHFFGVDAREQLLRRLERADGRVPEVACGRLALTEILQRHKAQVVQFVLVVMASIGISRILAFLIVSLAVKILLIGTLRQLFIRVAIEGVLIHRVVFLFQIAV